jgi:predicted signal transduction protein with EAL and GGDEF domain
MAVRQADGGTYAIPASWPRDAPDVRRLRLLALAGGSVLALLCALAVCLLHAGHHGNLDWNAALEMSLLSAGLTGTLALGAYAIGLRNLFIRQKSLEDDLRRRDAAYREQASYDELTGLPARTLLTDRVRLAIAEGARTDNQFAFMIVGMDHLKEVNDSLGHGAGDALLSVAPERQQLL